MGKDRRIGIGLIVVAALALILVNRISGRDVPGQAVALPPIPVPSVGACIDSTGTEPVEVSCSEPHTGEVIESWSAGTKPEASTPEQPGGTCIIAFAQITPTGSGWAPPPYEIQRVDVAAGGPIGWGACVQEPIGALDSTRSVRYTGRLAENTSVAGYPPQLRSCLADSLQVSGAEPYPVSCTYPHDWELLAVSGPGAAPTPPCAEFARSIVGSAAAFSGAHPLTAGEMPGAYSSPRIIVNPGETTVVYVDSGASNCAVRASPGRQLVGSVVGLGDKPLPYG